MALQPQPHHPRLRAALFTGLLLLGAACPATELNTANQAELEQVKGVGPQLSERLLQERRHGPFTDWAALVRRMKGVGPASAAKLSAGGLTVNGLAYTPPFSLSASSSTPPTTPPTPTSASASASASAASSVKP